MIGHQAPAVDPETFVFLAKDQAIHNQVAVFRPGKNVYPFYYGKGEKMNFCLVSDLVTFMLQVRKIDTWLFIRRCSRPEPNRFFTVAAG